MRTYQITFLYNGRTYYEQVTASSAMHAKNMIYAQFEGARVMSIREVK